MAALYVTNICICYLPLDFVKLLLNPLSVTRVHSFDHTLYCVVAVASEIQFVKNNCNNATQCMA